MHDSYERWLEEAKRWSPDSACWSDERVAEFLGAFQQLAVEKCAEHHQLALDAKLRQMGEACQHALTFVGWRMRVIDGALTAEQIPQWTASLVQLIEELKTVERLFSGGSEGGFDAIEARFTELQRRVQTARDLLRQLQPFFVEINGTDAGQSKEFSGMAIEEERHVEDTVPVPTIETTNVEAAEAFAQEELPGIEPAEAPSSPPPPQTSQVASTNIVREPPLIDIPELTPVELEAIEPAIEIAVANPAPIVQDWNWIDTLLENARTATQNYVADESTEKEDEIHGASDTEQFARLFWDCLAQGDIAGTYWFARVMEATGEAPPIPANTVAAMQALNWYSATPDDLLGYCSPVTDAARPLAEDGGLAVLGSAMRMALFAPSIVQTESTSFARVLSENVPVPLEPVAQAVLKYSESHRPLTQQHVLSIAGKEKGAAANRQITVDLKQWLEKAALRSLRLFEATVVYRIWATPGGRMHNDALPALDGRFDEIERVATSARQWADKHRVEALLNADYRRQRGIEGLDDIERDTRERVWEDTAQFARLLQAWCDSAGALGGVSRDPFAARVGVLRDQMRAAEPTVADWLRELRASASGPHAAAATHLHRELASLYAAQLLDFSAVPAGDTDIVASWYRSSGDLDSGLRRRLHLVPGVNADDDVDLEERLPAIGLSLASSVSGVDAATRVRQWLAEGDFRWIDSWLDVMGQTPVAMQLRQTAADRRSESIRLLRDELDVAMREVQQAGVNQWMNNDEAERLLRELDDVIPEKELLIPAVTRKITAIQRRCREALAARLAELTEQWRALHAALVSANVDAASLNDLAANVRQTIEGKDIRAADILLNEISKIADQTEGAEAALSSLVALSRDTRESLLDEFLAIEPRLSEWLEFDDVWEALPEESRYLPDKMAMGHALLEGRLVAPASSDSKREVVHTLEDWIALRQIALYDGSSGQIEAIERTNRVLHFLGFACEKLEGPPVGKDDSLLLTTKMSAGRHSPIPLWGSQAGELYRVLMLRNTKPAAIHEEIERINRDKSPLILLYAGHLGVGARRDLASWMRAEGQPILVLDDVLLLFLITREGHRLRAFFECALPFSWTNPYLDAGDAPVPPELFQGQKEAVEQLMDRRGRCFICGGRQLGKSALQKHIQKQFDRLRPHSHVWYVNVKDCFNPRERQNASLFWHILHQHFVDHNLLGPSRPGSRLPDVPGMLKQTFLAEPSLEVTIFLDEADALLESMIQDGRSLWTGVRTLVEQTGYRLKIVFAGNYHISRFAAVHNQSVTLLGAPIEIGPMVLARAADLVVKPLRALGYYTDSRAVLNILSFTHRHAGLLQLFMHELLGAKSRQIQSGPPYRVTADDVEKLQQSPDMRKLMKERLDMTLMLDPEYRCLAYVMLLDQENSGDFRVQYDAAELRRKALALWRSGFEELKNADVEARLNEMCTLGITVRRGDRFRLAGPHLVTLFGDYAKIRADADDLTTTERKPKFHESGVHGWIGTSAGKYSPLTLVQERVFQEPQTAVGLLYLSRAGGLGEIVEALQTLLGPGNGLKPADCLIPPELTEPKDIVAWISKFRRKQRHGSHAVLVQIARVTAPSVLFRQIEAADLHCSKTRDSFRATVRVVFVLEPAAGWAWLQNDKLKRESIEQRAFGVSCWNSFGVAARLEDLRKIYTSEKVEAVLNATAGWHYLLNKLFVRWPSRDENPDKVCMELSAALEDPSSDASREFVASLGLERDLAPERIFREFIELGAPVMLEDALELFGAETGSAIEFLQRYGLIAVRDAGGGMSLNVEPLAERSLRLQIQSLPPEVSPS